VTTTTKDLTLIYTYLPWDRELPAGARHRHRRICKASLLKWKHWPSTQGDTHGQRPENLMRFVFELL